MVEIWLEIGADDLHMLQSSPLPPTSSLDALKRRILRHCGNGLPRVNQQLHHHVKDCLGQPSNWVTSVKKGRHFLDQID